MLKDKNIYASLEILGYGSNRQLIANKLIDKNEYCFSDALNQ